MYPYRVFICYSRRDEPLERKLRRYLTQIGVEPMSNVHIPAGVPFPEDIMTKIGYAHVFMPLLTEESSRRPWVNQEIGYAMAFGVPIIPLAVGKLPEGMTDRLQARPMDRNLTNLARVLSPNTIKVVVDRAKEPSKSAKGSFPVTSVCANQIHQRTQILVNYAKSVLDLDHKGPVRQLVAFGSFTIPNKDPYHPAWDKRDGRQKR